MSTSSSTIDETEANRRLHESARGAVLDYRRRCSLRDFPQLRQYLAQRYPHARQFNLADHGLEDCVRLSDSEYAAMEIAYQITPEGLTDTWQHPVW